MNLAHAPSNCDRAQFDYDAIGTHRSFDGFTRAASQRNYAILWIQLRVAWELRISRNGCNYDDLLRYIIRFCLSCSCYSSRNFYLYACKAEIRSRLISINKEINKFVSISDKIRDTLNFRTMELRNRRTPNVKALELRVGKFWNRNALE